MKTKSLMTRTLSFVLALAMCVPMLFALTSSASAASSQISYGLSTSACRGNLNSGYSFPAHKSTVSVGQQLYINVEKRTS